MGSLRRLALRGKKLAGARAVTPFRLQVRMTDGSVKTLVGSAEELHAFRVALLEAIEQGFEAKVNYVGRGHVAVMQVADVARIGDVEAIVHRRRPEDGAGDPGKGT